MDVELELRGSMHALEDELTPGCELVAMQLLCYGALPVCSDNGEWVWLCVYLRTCGYPIVHTP